MMIEKDVIPVYSHNPYDATRFPLLVLDVKRQVCKPYNEGFRVFHWHDEIQFVYILQGIVHFHIYDKEEDLRAGDCMFINQAALHQIMEKEDCHYHSYIIPVSYTHLHWRGYVISDVWSRYKMLQGYYLIHPMGWDAFGLPAENYAIKMGVHPAKSTAENVANIKRQINEIAAVYDWDMEVNTTDPNFYKWTQWIFVKMFKEGLAYEKEMPINWCPSCKTGLANEEVVNGNCCLLYTSRCV